MKKMLAYTPWFAGAFLFVLMMMATPTRSAEQKTMVARMWHGRTPQTKAAEYSTYLYDQGIKKIRAIPGNQGAQVFRRNDNGVTDFIVISYWNSREDIKKFAGEDIEKTHNLARDPEFLLEMEPKVKHYDLIVNEWQ